MHGLPKIPELIFAGLVLIVSRYLMTGVLEVLKRLGLLLLRGVTTSIQVDGQDEAHGWITRWLAEHPYSARARHLSLSTSHRHQDPQPQGAQGAQGAQGDDRHDRRGPRVLLFPALGTHLIVHRHRLLLLTREQEKSTQQGGEPAARTGETLTLRMLGRDRQMLRSLVKEALHLSSRSDEGKTVIYGCNTNIKPRVKWRRMVARKIRPVDSVVLDDGLAEELLTDVRRFLASAESYAERGIPYRRGYLLYGPPGCGKTSFVLALAGQLKMDLCYLSLSSPSLTDENLSDLFLDAPQGSMMLLEDVDAAFVHRTAQHASSITFSGLLNAIDGVAAQEGRILCMTTNHIERLSPAMIRPGRIDRSVFVGLTSRSQVRRMFERFFPAETALAEEFARRVPEQTVSGAQLQCHLLKYAHAPRAALEHAGELLRAEPYIRESLVAQTVDERASA